VMKSRRPAEKEHAARRGGEGTEVREHARHEIQQGDRALAGASAIDLEGLGESSVVMVDCDVIKRMGHAHGVRSRAPRGAGDALSGWCSAGR